MEGNPFVQLAQTLKNEARKDGVMPLRLGQVLSVSPLMVQTGGLVLSGGDLLLNAAMLPRGGETPDPGELTPGCQVALITADNQLFVVACKVVSP